MKNFLVWIVAIALLTFTVIPVGASNSTDDSDKLTVPKQGINCAVGLDYSYSYGNVFYLVKILLSDFVRDSIQPGDTFSLVTFSHESKILFSQIVTKKNKAEILNLIDSIKLSKELGTEVFDGYRLTAQCLNQFEGTKPFNVLMFFTDGYCDYMKIVPSMPKISSSVRTYFVGYSNYELNPNLYNTLKDQGMVIQVVALDNIKDTMEQLGQQVDKYHPEPKKNDGLDFWAWFGIFVGITLFAFSLLICKLIKNARGETEKFKKQERMTVKVAKITGDSNPIEVPYRLISGQKVEVGKVDYGRGFRVEGVNGFIALEINQTDNIEIDPNQCDKVELVTQNGNRLISQKTELQNDANRLLLSGNVTIQVRR